MTVVARACAALALAALVVTTAGCAAPLSPHSSGAPSAALSGNSVGNSSTAPSAKPTPWPAGLTFPPGPFADGNCEKLLASTIIRKTLRESQNATVTNEDPAVAAAGGISCDYVFGQGQGADDVQVEVAPSAIADAGEVTASLAQTYCGFEIGAPGADPCTTTGVVAGWWYNLSDTTSTSRSLKSKQASFAVMTADLEETLTAVTAPAQVRSLQRFDCDAANTTDELLATTSNYVYDSLDYGEIAAAANLWGGATATCIFAMPGEAALAVTVYPGGASVYGQCTHSYWSGHKSVDVTVPGVQSAFELDPKDSAAICATDGRSAVSVGIQHTDSDGNYSWTTDELSSLGELLVPVFAAAAPPTAARVASLATSSAPNAVSPLAGGNCTKLLDNKALATALGEKAPGFRAVDPLLATVGGIDCDYDFGQPKGADEDTEVTVQVAPSAIADATERDASLQSPICGAIPYDLNDENDEDACTETVVADGWWFRIKFKASEGANLPTLTSISHVVEKALATTAAPTSVGVSQPVQCPATDNAGAPVTRSRTMRAMVGDEAGTYNAIRTAAFLLAGPVTCEFSLPSSHRLPYGDEWSLTVYPRSTSAYLGCVHGLGLSGGKTISIPGVKTAVTLDGQAPYFNEACATDGTSTVHVYDLISVAAPVTKATMQVLSTLLVPIFAAASK